MYVTEVEKLARYLMSPGVTAPDVCKFLALETFARLRTSAVYAAEITSDGCIAPIAVFGLPSKVMTDWGNLPLTVDAPLTDAVRDDRIVLLERHETFEKYPILRTYEGIPDNWDSYLVCPVIPYGVMALTLNSVPKLNKELELFIRAAVAMAALHFLKSEIRVEQFVRKPSRSRSQRSGVLTERQQLIKRFIEKGYSNPAIAEEIGYSESLVRQETMAIYATLNISGRKELLQNQPE
jgi:DNA-binding CsgD family transcriptional regulator